VGPPLEAQADFCTYKINNNKFEQKMKNKRGEEYIKMIDIPPSIREWFPPYSVPRH
jgi:hypothetical protein